jgi:hypothetical protein
MKTARTEVELHGVVRDVLRFRGSAEGMGVITLMDKDGTRQKAVGVCEGISPGDYVEVSGYEQEHPTYGMQIRAQRVVTSFPTTKKTFLEWIQRHFQAPWKNANALVEDWYENFGTLGQSPKGGGSLVPLTGPGDFELIRLWNMVVSDQTGAQVVFAKHGLSAEFIDIKMFVQRKNTVDGLMKMGLDTKEAHALFMARGNRALEELRTDPYVVYYYLENVPFAKIDKVYLGQPENKKVDDRRVKAVCLHELRSCTDEGHTAMYYSDFIDLVEETYPEFSVTRLMSNFDALIPEFVTLYGSPTMVQLTPYARYEAGIAEFVVTGRVQTLPPELEDTEIENDGTADGA